MAVLATASSASLGSLGSMASARKSPLRSSSETTSIAPLAMAWLGVPSIRTMPVSASASTRSR